jgi:broad specificity phosphatase PhoE
VSTRYLEVRRHTTRAKPGVHLSPAGILRAQRVAQTSGPFARVVTSPVTRAYETAVAMGLAVDEQDERLAMMDDAVELELPWPFSFAEAAAAVQRGGAAARFAAAQAQVWRDVVAAVPDGGSALIITHGGIVELGAVGCMPRADHASWGPYCDTLEGIRLAFDGQDFVAAEVLRVG